MRRLALILTVVLGLGILPASVVHAMAGESLATQVPVLVYHHIVPGKPAVPLEVGARSFARQLSYMKLSGYYFASSGEVADFAVGRAQLPHPSVLLTFDDGFADNYSVAFPILKQYGARATMYIITSRVGTPGYLTEAQIAEMHASGLVEFQLHTDALHYKTDDGRSAVLAVPPAVLMADLALARQKLAAWTGDTATSFAYPFGFYDDAVAEPLAAAGVTTAYTVEPGFVRPGDNPYRLNRIPVFGTLGQRYLFRFIGILENRRFR